MSITTLDPNVLRHDYIPDRILHRDKQQELVTQSLIPLYQKSIPPNLLVYGKPGTGKTLVVNEYGNVKPDMLPTQEKREPLIDTLVDEKEKTLKVVAEMPGVEKSDVGVVVGVDRVIHIDAERGEKKYHVKVPIKHKVDPEPPKATYKNGILELVFKLEDEKSNGTAVNVL